MVMATFQDESGSCYAFYGLGSEVTYNFCYIWLPEASHSVIWD